VVGESEKRFAVRYGKEREKRIETTRACCLGKEKASEKEDRREGEPGFDGTEERNGSKLVAINSSERVSCETEVIRG
jgi:hypothetical protein